MFIAVSMVLFIWKPDHLKFAVEANIKSQVEALFWNPKIVFAWSTNTSPVWKWSNTKVNTTRLSSFFSNSKAGSSYSPKFDWFQMVELPVLRSHSKSWPFANGPLFDHSKSWCIWISDPRIIIEKYWRLIQLLYAYSLTILDLSVRAVSERRIQSAEL